MKFYYQIEELPKSNEFYRLATDIEGHLSITSDNGEIFFQSDGILLVELAIFCKIWLDENSSTDFYYSSMDFEESPILSFRAKSPETYYLTSVWRKSKIDGIPISEIKSSMREYIEDLKANLKNNFSINIEGYEGL